MGRVLSSFLADLNHHLVVGRQSERNHFPFESHQNIAEVHNSVLKSRRGGVVLMQHRKICARGTDKDLAKPSREALGWRVSLFSYFSSFFESQVVRRTPNAPASNNTGAPVCGASPPQLRETLGHQLHCQPA